MDKLISAPRAIANKRERYRNHLHVGDNMRAPADITDTTGSLPRGAPNHVPRDPIQPISGSLHHRQSLDSFEDENEDEEEGDFFPAGDIGTTFRQRSNTCPEQRVHARKVKCRARNRPLTPPPANCVEDSAFAAHMSKLVIKDKFHIHQDLPRAIPEQETEESPLDTLDEDDDVPHCRNCDSPITHEETGLFEMDD